MTSLWRGVSARLRPGSGRPPTATPRRYPDPAGLTPVRGARRRQLADLWRRVSYAPELDGLADPGEIVWTWVRYEDDPCQGKDRPVLVVGRHHRTLFGLMLSSQSDRDGQRHWLALGSGAWDGERRPSWVRLDRVLTLREDGIRREGAVLDRTRFNRVCRALRAGYGWH